MQEFLEEKLNEIKKHRTRRNRLIAIALVLSLLVSLDVFWVLRRPGLTLAGDAECGVTEHSHSAQCAENCEHEEHIHSVSCYSDEKADVESPLYWQDMFEAYPYTGDLRKDLVGIAQTQVGYTESKLNFEVGADGIRRGYTRYGDWYGTPYNDWSAIFVSFCLNYAKANPDENPGNIGASSLAKLWKNRDKYAPIGKYTPCDGDLVFFENNTVGIVVKVYNATFYVIRGDVDNAVRTSVMSLADSSIIGWGSTVGKVTLSETEQNEIPDILDISNGPAVFIFEGGQAPTQTKAQTYSLRNSRAITDLLPYLEANGGDYFFTLLDKNNQELPKDENDNYIVQADTDYKLTISFTSPEGFLPGTYQYQIPNGLLVDGGEGTFVLKDGTNVGDWVVTDDGLITLNFNNHMNSRTDITISATLGIHFPEKEELIDFDGKITVTIEKPPVQQNPTKVYKWGIQGGEGNGGKTDDTKLYWTVQIIGNKDSQIPGSVLTDNVLSGEWIEEHRYTQSDIEGGLTFGVSEPDPVTGAEKAWHSWHISADDPNLVWTETGWAYTMPETATCQWCGEVILGNDGWIYTIDYTSTPEPSSVAGSLAYMNHVEIDHQYVDGWASFTHGEMHGIITKDGNFLGDASGGSFLWEFQATIPGRQEGQKADYFWYIMDYMDVRDSGGWLAQYIENDADNSRVLATHNGETFSVPRIQDATIDDEFAWHNYWSADRNGVYYGRQINLLCRCHCTEESCPFWNNGRCGSEYWYEADDGNWYTNGYCQCWTPTEYTTFTFVYKTEDLSVVEAYGGLGYQLRNEAVLYHRPSGTDGVLVDNDQANVPIPSLFKKELTQDFDGYTANYKITINEAKLVLTDGSPLTIHDVMTQTLAFISGSLIITAEDTNGNITELQQGVDYTVTYDGTGNEKDENGNPVHLLDIVILHPQPVMYTLDYDATLIIPTGTTQAIKYNNSATISLWGNDITDTSPEKVFADINISAKSYKVEMFKTSSTTGEPLGGATFGLYNSHGGLITTDVTDANGSLLFQTNIIEGIILREHVLYYMQELEAPDGYRLDDTKYWFCFCNETGDSCEECDRVMAGVDALRIPFEQLKKVNVTNEKMGYILPATGGMGQTVWILSGLCIMLSSLVFGYILRRKRERRGDG